MRVLLTGGGTGGHVNPALAIADIIKKREPDSVIAYVGRKDGIEDRLAGKEGYKMYHIRTRGFSRSLSPKNIPALIYYFTAPRSAGKIIREFKPDIVIGTGGYVSYAPLLAAVRLGVPTAVHESNALPGLAVRMLQDKVDRILLNFPESVSRLEHTERAVVVGNPVRVEFGKYTRADARRLAGIPDKYKNVLLSFGGSLGAPAINKAALGFMTDYDIKHPETLHIHSTGNTRYDDFMREIEKSGVTLPENVRVSDYVYNMPLIMAAADVVVCRAGAMTVTEISGMKKAAVMIPSDHVADNHQYKNAKMLADADAVILVEEKELNGGRFAKEVADLLNDKNRRDALGVNIAAFSRKNAADLIFDEIKKLTVKK